MKILGSQNFSAVYPPDTQQDFRLLSEIPLDLPSGGKRIFDIAKTPLLDNRLNPYGTVIVFEDITDRINLQQRSSRPKSWPPSGCCRPAWPTRSTRR